MLLFNRLFQGENSREVKNPEIQVAQYFESFSESTFNFLRNLAFGFGSIPSLCDRQHMFDPVLNDLRCLENRLSLESRLCCLRFYEWLFEGFSHQMRLARKLSLVSNASKTQVNSHPA